MTTEEIDIALKNRYPDLNVIGVDPGTFIFEERVRHKCFHCKNYNVKWTCPPNTPAVNYPGMFREFDNGVIVYCQVSVDAENFEEQRSLSTNHVHRALLYLEKVLYDNNQTLTLSFIGGSCKLCKNGCNDKRCANPALSRIPLEGTGVNVIKSLGLYGIDISFPIKDTLCRYGLILW